MSCNVAKGINIYTYMIDKVKIDLGRHPGGTSSTDSTLARDGKEGKSEREGGSVVSERVGLWE